MDLMGRSLTLSEIAGLFELSFCKRQKYGRSSMEKITVIFNEYSPSLAEGSNAVTDEHTQTSANLIGDCLSQLGYRVRMQPVSPQRIRAVSKIQDSMVFNMCEWSGKDYHLGVKVIKVLEKSRISFTGADSHTYYWDSKKDLMKKLFRKLSIPTPEWSIYNGGKIKHKHLKFPVIVKPAWEHCAIGISQDSVCRDINSVERKAIQLWETYKQPIIIEEFVSGNEYQVFVFEKNGRSVVLPPAQISYNKTRGFLPLLTFEGKWGDGYETKLSQIGEFTGSPTKLTKLKKLAKDAFRKLNCRDYVRFDVREKNGEFYVLEVNANPGLDTEPEYGLSVAAKALNMDITDIVELIVNSAKHRGNIVANKIYDNIPFHLNYV
jgi:D-alanine-D-alanine ligase